MSTTLTKWYFIAKASHIGVCKDLENHVNTIEGKNLRKIEGKALGISRISVNPLCGVVLIPMEYGPPFVVPLHKTAKETIKY